MPTLEGAEEVKLEPEQTIAERVKLNSQKITITGTGLKILTPNKSLARLAILLVQTKARNDSNKLKSEITHILYLFYLHNKISKKVYNNLIKSL